MWNSAKTSNSLKVCFSRFFVFLKKCENMWNYISTCQHVSTACRQPVEPWEQVAEQELLADASPGLVNRAPNSATCNSWELSHVYIYQSMRQFPKLRNCWVFLHSFLNVSASRFYKHFFTFPFLSRFFDGWTTCLHFLFLTLFLTANARIWTLSICDSVAIDQISRIQNNSGLFALGKYVEKCEKREICKIMRSISLAAA